MLKTNSKQAKENIKNYIIENFTMSNYPNITPPTDWHGIAKFIYDCFRSQKWACVNDYRYYSNSEFTAFYDWCAGLPSVLDTCYFYNCSAVEDLGSILEQTEAERSKYEECEAEKLLTLLIYNTIKKELEK